MRRYRAPLFLLTLMVASPAFAQDVKPEEAKPAEPSAAAPASEAAPAAQAPEAAPAATASASGSANLSLGGGSASADAKADASAPQAEPKKAEADTERAGSYGGPVSDTNNDWKMGYSGYFRAPMRIGIGVRDKSMTYPGQSKTTLHSPLVPDDQYLSWQHTNHSHRDWAEMFFSYGNAWAKGVLAVQGYNFTDASFNMVGTQFGIGQGWMEVTPPMPWDNVRFKMKAGSFWNRYGAMGRYDAGEYDTYLFGRTHSMGENMRLEFDMADQPLTIGIEHGIGTKRPDASVYETARFTMLHHAHVDMLWDQSIMLGLHFLHSWTQEEARFTGYQPAWVVANNTKLPYLSSKQPDGSMSIFGAEARFDMPDVFGYLYLGASYIHLKDAITVGSAVEVIHSNGGGSYNMGVTSNYLDSEICRWNLSNTKVCSNGNGNVLSVGGQYETKLSDMLGQSPFGVGQDLTWKLYGMWNKVQSEDKYQDGVTKMKVGTDLFFDATQALAFATRFDYLAPNSRFANQNFMILSPRLVFRSQLVTHEQIAFQYSRYIYKQRECVVGTPADVQDSIGRSQAMPAAGSPFPGVPGETYSFETATAKLAEAECVQPPPSTVAPEGWGSMTESLEPKYRGMPFTGRHLRPDVNVVSIEASMWW